MRGSTSASYQQLRLRMSSSSLNASLLPLHPERGVLGIWQACELARPNSIVAASMIVLILEAFFFQGKQFRLRCRSRLLISTWATSGYGLFSKPILAPLK